MVHVFKSSIYTPRKIGITFNWAIVNHYYVPLQILL